MEKIKELEQELIKGNVTNFQFLFVNLLNSLEKSLDIVWIFFIELENEYLKRLEISLDLQHSQREILSTQREFLSSQREIPKLSGNIMQLITDFKFIKGIIKSFLKENKNTRDLELGEFEHLEPFLAVNQVLLGICPDLKEQVVFSDENSKYHHSFFLYAKEKESEILQLKEKLNGTEFDIKNSNLKLLEENLKLKREISEKDSNYDAKLKLAELRFKSVSQVDLQGLQSEFTRENSDFTEAVKDLEPLLTLEHDAAFNQKMAQNIPSIYSQEEDFEKMFTTLQSMDSKMNLLAQQNDKSQFSDHLGLAEHCLEELKIVRETLYKISVNTLISPATTVEASSNSAVVYNVKSLEAHFSTFEKTIQDLKDENDRLRDALSCAKESCFSDAFKDISSVATQVDNVAEHQVSETETENNRLGAEIQRLCDELSALQSDNKRLNEEAKLKDEELVQLKSKLQHFEIAYDGSQKQIMKMANDEANFISEKAELKQSLKDAATRISEIENSKNYCIQENMSLLRQLQTLNAVTKSTKRENRDMYEVFLESQAEEQDFLIVNQQLTDCLEGLQREFRKLDEKLCDKTEINKALNSKLEEAQKFISDLNNKCQMVDHDLLQSNERTHALAEELDKSKKDSHTFQSRLHNVDIALRDQIQVNQIQRLSLDQARTMIQELRDHSNTLATQLHEKMEINKILNLKTERDQKTTQETQHSLLETTIRLRKTQEQLKSFRSAAQKLNEELISKNELNRALNEQLTDSQSTIHKLEEDLKASNQGIRSLNIELGQFQTSAQKLNEELNAEREHVAKLKLKLGNSMYASEKIIEELNVTKERVQSLNSQQNESESIIMKLDDELKANDELNKSLNVQLLESESNVQKLEEELESINQRMQSISVELFESQSTSNRLDGELKATKLLNQSLTLQVSDSESAIQKLEDELTATQESSQTLQMQLFEAQSNIQKLDEELKATDQLNQSLNIFLAESHATAEQLGVELKVSNDSIQSLNAQLNESQISVQKLSEELKTEKEANKSMNLRLSESQVVAQRLSDELSSTKEHVHSLDMQHIESQTLLRQLDDELNSSKELNQSLNRQLSESDSTIHRLEEELQSSNENIQSINSQLIEALANSDRIEGELKARDVLNQSLNSQISESQVSIQKLEEDLKSLNDFCASLNQQLVKSESSVDALDRELKAANDCVQVLNAQLSDSQKGFNELQANGKRLQKELSERTEINARQLLELEISEKKVRSDSAHIQLLEKSVSDFRLDYEASSKRSSILISENSQLKGLVHETKALNTALNMEITVLNQKFVKLQNAFAESKELHQIPIVIHKMPQLDIKGTTMPELKSPITRIQHLEIKELEDSLHEISKDEKLESEKLEKLSGHLTELLTTKCARKKKFVDELQSLQRNMNAHNDGNEPPYEYDLGQLNEQLRLEISEISKNEESVKAQIEDQTKILKSLKEKKKNIHEILKKSRKDELAQKKFFRNQIDQFNAEYVRDMESLNARRSELFNNLQTFEHILESVVNSKMKLELVYKSELEKLEKNHENHQLYNLQLKLLNFSFDTEFLILNRKEESMNESMKKLKHDLNHLEEAKSNFKMLRENAESHVRSEYKVNFEESISDIEVLGIPLEEEQQNSAFDYYEDNVLQQLSKIIQLLTSQNDENRVLDEMTFIRIRDGYEARIKEINSLRDQTIKILNETHSDAISKLSNNLKSQSQESKRKEEAFLKELEVLKQELRAKSLATETIIAEQEHIIEDSSQKLEQYRKESENFQLIMNNIMDLQARETETISLRESRKFKNKLKNILDNAKALKLQNEEYESKCHVFTLENIDLTKKLDQLKISISHLSKQNELLTHELQDSKIKLRMKSLDELENVPKEKTVEEKERILEILSSYKAIQSRLKEDLTQLKSLETESLSKEVVYFVQIGYETFLDALQVIIHYLSADVGILKNSGTDISENQVVKIRKNILSVENIVHYASRVFSLSEESATLNQFVSNNETFKEALRAKYDESSIKPSPSIELLIDQGLTNLLPSSEKDMMPIFNFINERNYYKNAYDELQLHLASIRTQSVESQTENQGRRVSIQTESLSALMQNKEMQTSRVLIGDKELQTSRMLIGDKELQTSRMIIGDKELQTSRMINEDKEFQTSRIFNADQELQTSRIFNADQELQTSRILHENREFQTSRVIYQDEDLQTSRVIYQDEDLQTSRVIYQDEDLQTSRVINTDQQLQTSRIICPDKDIQTSQVIRGESWVQTDLNIDDLKLSYESKINKLQNELEKVISEKKFLKSSFRNSQEEQSKAYRLADSYSLEKEKILAEKVSLMKQIPILESVKYFIEQSFEQSQVELGKARSKIEQLKQELETVSMEKAGLQSALIQNQSQMAKLNDELEQLERDNKSKESLKKSVDARFSRSQIEIEQLKSKIRQTETKSKALESENSILQTNLDSLSSQLTDSVRDANDLRSLNQKLLSDYNSLVDKLFQQNGKGSRNINDQNFAATLKDVNYLLDEARSNEIALSNKLKERNSTITDLSEKLRMGSQQKLENEKHFQKTINDLSLQHIQALEAKDKSILVLEDTVAQNKRQQEGLESKVKALEIKEESLEKNIQLAKKEFSEKLESNLYSSIQRQKDADLYIQNIFLSLEESLEKSESLNTVDCIQNLVAAVQMKILRPDISKKEESKVLFKQVSAVLIGLESLLSKIHLSICAKKGSISTQLNESVSIISGIVSATTVLEDLAPLAKIVSQHLDAFKKSLLDEGVDLWIDQKVQFEVANAIRMAIEQSKKVKSVIKKTLPSPKVGSPETPLIKDILNSPLATVQEPDESWLVDQDLKKIHQITKQSIMETIGTLSSVYKAPQTIKFSRQAQPTEDVFKDSSDVDAELARMKTITDMNVARTLRIATSLQGPKTISESF